MDAPPYGLDPHFEKVVLWYCSRSPKFWAMVGSELDPKGLEVEHGTLLLETVRQLARESGSPPTSTLIVIQRLKRRVAEGKVTIEQVKGVGRIFDDVEEQEIPGLDEVVAELVPVVKRSMQSRAILLSHEEYARRGDFSTVRSLLDRTERLGMSDVSVGARLGPAGFDKIAYARAADRLPTGVLELDMKLDGGVLRGTLFTWLADSGAGKSIALISQAGECLRMGMFVGYITLELPEHIQLARLYANLTGVLTNDILLSDKMATEAKRRYAMVESKLGVLEMAELSQGATVRELAEWVDRKEQEHGDKMEVLIIDYPDKMSSPMVREDNQYLMMKHVYGGLRQDIAKSRQMWVVGASQASRPSKDRTKFIGQHNVADSMHKIRESNLVVSINRDDEEGTVVLWVAKNNFGAALVAVGPLVTDSERGRLVPVSRELGPW